MGRISINKKTNQLVINQDSTVFVNAFIVSCEWRAGSVDFQFTDENRIEHMIIYNKRLTAEWLRTLHARKLELVGCHIEGRYELNRVFTLILDKCTLDYVPTVPELTLRNYSVNLSIIPEVNFLTIRSGSVCGEYRYNQIINLDLYHVKPGLELDRFVSTVIVGNLYVRGCTLNFTGLNAINARFHNCQLRFTIPECDTEQLQIYDSLVKTFVTTDTCTIRYVLMVKVNIDQLDIDFNTITVRLDQTTIKRITDQRTDQSYTLKLEQCRFVTNGSIKITSFGVGVFCVGCPWYGYEFSKNKRSFEVMKRFVTECVRRRVTYKKRVLGDLLCADVAGLVLAC
jgi:hypothetical protein